MSARMRRQSARWLAARKKTDRSLWCMCRCPACRRRYSSTVRSIALRRRPFLRILVLPLPHLLLREAARDELALALELAREGARAREGRLKRSPLVDVHLQYARKRSVLLSPQRRDLARTSGAACAADTVDEVDRVGCKVGLHYVRNVCNIQAARRRVGANEDARPALARRLHRFQHCVAMRHRHALVVHAVVDALAAEHLTDLIRARS
mmetsp:Transcript_516/g.1390  ORF Transcript_516/g.1390 Transcript_516/m.1390 type:complete len:209 (+) Transcript_516:164-790(+)